VSERTCTIEGCPNQRLARGWCPKHYRRWRAYGHPIGTADKGPRRRSCSVDGCPDSAYRASLCSVHYASAGSPRLKERACEHCGDLFEPRNHSQRFCNTTCSARGKLPEEYKALLRQGRKRCYACEQTKSLDEFYRNKSARDGRTSRCKLCSAAYHADHHAKSSVRERTRELKRAARYGLLAGDYDAILLVQGKRCAICQRPPEAGEVLHVDHCHESGRVRGLLCRKCNVGLGLFSDDPARLLRAASYIREML
jgi:Recombination endonuclease VII